MTWVLSSERHPKQPKWYRVLCVNGKAYKCKFMKGKNGPKEYSIDYFKYNKRAIRDLAWMENA